MRSTWLAHFILPDLNSLIFGKNIHYIILRTPSTSSLLGPNIIISYLIGTGGHLSGSKAAGVWNRDEECVELYLHSQYGFMAW
jgi:hypothetical protein